MVLRLNGRWLVGASKTDSSRAYGDAGPSTTQVAYLEIRLTDGILEAPGRLWLTWFGAWQPDKSEVCSANDKAQVAPVATECRRRRVEPGDAADREPRAGRRGQPVLCTIASVPAGCVHSDTSVTDAGPRACVPARAPAGCLHPDTRAGAFATAFAGATAGALATAFAGACAPVGWVFSHAPAGDLHPDARRPAAWVFSHAPALAGWVFSHAPGPSGGLQPDCAHGSTSTASWRLAQRSPGSDIRIA
jgi:hypothetical protein